MASSSTPSYEPDDRLPEKIRHTGDETLRGLNEATRRKLGEAFANIKPADLARLYGYVHKNLSHVLRRIPELEPEDLVGEVLLRILNDKRHWKEEPLEKYLFDAVRSIADDYYKKYKVRSRRQNANPERSNPEQSSDDVEGELLAREEEQLIEGRLKELSLLLKGDIDATNILQAVLAGFEPAKVREMFGMDAARYDAARKRFSRACKRLLQRYG